jgi:DNA-binding CsgD family transcriptional regulator
MEYITVQEAAKKWKISERLVQKYCADGRIEGARKFGKSWEIPSVIIKPQDPRKAKNTTDLGNSQQQQKVFLGFMPLMNTPFKPGHCMDYINEIEDGPRKDIALAEYHYFSGQPEKAIQESELYLTCPDPAYRFSACLIYAYASLSVGQIQHARYALTEIRSTLAANANKAPYIRAIETFVVFASSVLLHLPLPTEMPSVKEFLPLLPHGLRAFALYVQAHYLYLKEEYEKSAGVVEATLDMGAEQYPIPAIYLHLVAVMDYMSLKQTKRAQWHLLSAWELARPDDLIEGFGEHHGLLGGMLEAVIKPDWPADFKRIIAITYRFSAGWRKIHNPETGHDVADDLTTTEFATAMLAARGWTNQEIGQHMNISSHTVKRYISTVLQKLGIRQRQELKKYMLK